MTVFLFFTVKNICRRIKEKAVLIFMGALIMSVGFALLEISINSAAITGSFQEYNEEFLFGCLFTSIVFSLIAYGDLVNGIYHMNQDVYSMMQTIGYKKKQINEAFLLEIGIINVLSVPIGLSLGRVIYRIFDEFITIYLETERSFREGVSPGAALLLVFVYVSSSIVVGLSILRNQNQLYKSQKSQNALLYQKKNGAIFLFLGAAIAFLIPAAGIISLIPSFLFVAYGIIHLVHGISEGKKVHVLHSEDINSIFVPRYLKAILTRQGRKLIFTIIILLVSFEVINFGVFFGKSEEYTANKYPFAAMVEEKVSKDDGVNPAKLFGEIDYYTVTIYSAVFDGEIYDLITRSDYEKLIHKNSINNINMTARRVNTTKSSSTIQLADLKELTGEDVELEPSSSDNLFNEFYTTEEEANQILLIFSDSTLIRDKMTIARRFYIAENVDGHEKNLYEELGKTDLQYYVRDVNVAYNKVIAARFYYIGIYSGLTLLLIGVGRILTLYFEQLRSFIKDLKVIHNNTSNTLLKRIILKHALIYVMPIILPFLCVFLQMLCFNVALVINKDLNMVVLIGKHMIGVMGIELILVCIYTALLYITTCSFCKIGRYSTASIHSYRNRKKRKVP